MNRIEIVGLFTALDMLCDMKEYDKIQDLVKKVLKEAERPDKETKVNDN